MENSSENSLEDLSGSNVGKAQENPDATRIDLGDDLIEKTAILTTPGFASAKVPPKTLAEAVSNQVSLAPAEASRMGVLIDKSGTPEDLLKSAEILFGEGLIDDAKKILHHILISTPGHVGAEQALKRVQEKELQELLHGESRRSVLGRSQKTLEPIDADQLIHQLDVDLELGLEGSIFEILSDPNSPDLLEQFFKKVEKDLSSADLKNWIDLGIGFLEMEMYPLACRLFAGAAKRIDPVMPQAAEFMVSAVSLEGLCYISMDRPHEAISCIQPVLKDVEIKFEEKTELYYLMGRAYEELGKSEIAREFYVQVHEIDPAYRDVNHRMKKVTRLP